MIIDRSLYDKTLEVLKSIKENFKEENFKILLEQNENDYFPDFLKENLKKYIQFYNDNLKKIIDESGLFSTDNPSQVINKIEIITNSINETIEKYYEGNIYQASLSLFNTFNNQIFLDNVDGIVLQNGKRIVAINTEKLKHDDFTFFRSRVKESYVTLYTKKDMFHIPFELRHKIKTNRYSIPGNPALYFGDTTYICWEELDRPKLEELFFSKFSINADSIVILSLKRVQDSNLYNANLDEFNDPKTTELEFSEIYNKLLFLFIDTMQYLSTFPLILACTIKVKNSKGAFKPEYIIPQLLIQYIQFINTDIKGIKYPSTKVDYSKLENLNTYNYVFPVRESAQEGFCKELKSAFYLTEPTSLELENVLFNPVGLYAQALDNSPIDTRKFEIIEGIKNYYYESSFGKIEHILRNRIPIPLI